MAIQLPYGITPQQVMIFLAILFLLWRLEQLPAIISRQLDEYVPQQLANIIKGK